MQAVRGRLLPMAVHCQAYADLLLLWRVGWSCLDPGHSYGGWLAFNMACQLSRTHLWPPAIRHRCAVLCHFPADLLCIETGQVLLSQLVDRAPVLHEPSH
jgi:hypothetical protein